jgi:long-chain fatty acid transport protein
MTKRLQIIVLALLLLPAVALANGYDVPNVNPRDLAMVGSGVAIQNDAAAAYANPAAMSRLGSGLQLSLAGSALFLTTNWTDTSGKLSPGFASTKFKPATPVSIFASYGGKLAGYDAALGAGVNVPAGGNVFWDDTWAGRGRIITVDRKIYAGYLTAGLALSPFVRVGGGLVYYYGTEYLKQGIQPDPNTYGELSTKGGAASWDLSFEANPSDELSIGADFKYLGKMNLKGDGHFQVPPALSSGTTQDQNVTHELTYPTVLNVGFGWRAGKKVLVSGAMTYNWYEVYREDLFEGDKGVKIPVERRYGNGSTYRLGAEFDVSQALQFRMGVLRDKSGLKTDYYSPTLPDANAWAWSAGFGYMLMPDVQLNMTGFYALLDAVTATGSSALPGRYSSSVWIVSAGVSWKTGVGGGGK